MNPLEEPKFEALPPDVATASTELYHPFVKPFQAAAAPDKQHLLEFAITLRNMPVPTVNSEAGNALRDDIARQIGQFAKWIEAHASTL